MIVASTLILRCHCEFEKKITIMQFFYVSLTAYFNRIKLLTACVNKIKAIDHTGVFGIIFICWILSCLILKNYFSVTIFATRPILFFILAV